jgi:hypothetical protein
MGGQVMMPQRVSLVAFVILTGAWIVLLVAWWQGTANFEAMKSAADTCHAALKRLAEASPKEMNLTDKALMDDLIARISAGPGLPQTCTIGELARDMNQPRVLWLCVAQDRWQGFPFQRFPAP